MECKLKIESIDCISEIDNMSNVVKNINWSYECFKDNKSHSVEGIQELPHPKEDDFIPTDEIDNNILTEWLLNYINIEEIGINMLRILDNDDIKEDVLINIPISE